MEWISCKDRMPEIEVRVLACTCQGRVWMVARRKPNKNQRGGPWVTDFGIYDEPMFTHWMPLPDPPKEAN
jgi:hypothetical protein